MRQPELLSRRQIHILGGLSGAGKTTLLLQVLADNLHGIAPVIPALAFQTKSIAYIVADRTQDDVAGHIENLGINRDQLEVYSIPDDLSFAPSWLKDGELSLRRVRDRLKRPYDTLVLEPLATFVDGSLNDFKCVQIALTIISRFAIEHNVRIIAEHYATKPRTDFDFRRPQDRLSGSAALQGFSSTQIVLIQGSERNLDHDSVFVIPHNAPQQEFSICRDTRGYFVPYTRW